MSIPNILLIIFIQAMIGEPTVISIAVVIGITGWMPVAKMVRSEVKQIRNSGLYSRGENYGREVFISAYAPSFTEFYAGNNVYDCDKRGQCYCGGGYA